MASLTGLVLAAGAGARFGGPKALARTASGEPWIARAVTVLAAVGCEPVVVVLGAEAEAAAALVPDAARIVIADGWRRGLGSSLAAGIAGLPEADAALITLVDLPAMPLAVPARLLQQGAARHALARAVYSGAPGHPVVLGRDHWAPLAASLRGDQGGRTYLSEHAVQAVECGDLFSGHDIDHR